MPGLLLLLLLLLPPPLLEAAAPRPERVTGSGHRTIRSSDAEIRTPSSPADSMDSLTTFGSSGERTLLSVTNSTVPAATTESVISDTEKISSVHLMEHFSVDQNRSSNISSSDADATELGVVPVVTRSSETPTDSFAKSEHAVIGSRHQTLSNWHAEKRTSSSHTESTYTAVAFSTGEDRTLQLLTNRSVSVDMLPDSGFRTEIPVSSDLTHRSSSVSQAGASNISDFPESSTGPLLMQPSSNTRLPAAEGRKQPASISDTEGKIASSHGDIAYVATPSPRGLHERTLRSLTDTGSSTSSAEISSSSDGTESSSIMSVLQIGRNNSSLDAMGFTENSTDPLHKGSLTATESVSAASGSQAVRTSATEERIPDSGVTGASVSAAFPRTQERMFLSPTSSKQPSQLTHSSSSGAQLRSVSDVIQSSSASPIAETDGINISPDVTNFREPSTDPLLMDFNSSSESASAASRSSHKISSMSALEKRRTSDYDTTSTYLSTAFTGTGERTLRSLSHNSKPLFATESSTSSAEMSSASDVIQLSSVSAAEETQGFNISSQAPGFAERSTDSHPPSESASPESESSQQPTNISVVEQRTSDPHATSMVISTAFTRAGEKILQSLTNSSLSPSAAQSSASSTDMPSSADVTQTSSISARAETNEGKVTLGVTYFTGSSADPMPTHFHSDSQGASAATGSSHQLINISSTEKRSPGSHTTSAYISAASTNGGDRMLRSVTESSRSDATQNSPFAELSSAADVTQSSSVSSTAQTTGMKNASFNATDPALLTDFSLASENVSTVFGSSHQAISISDTETRTSDSPITRSATITRDVEWSLSLTNTSTPSDARGSFVSSTEMLGSSELTQSSSISSVTQAHETNSPLRATDFTDLSLDPLLTHSLSTPENTSRAAGSSHQSISVSATEEGTSRVSTTSFYISTTSNRGEETLRPLTDRSTLTDTMESPSSTSANTDLTDLSPSSSSLAQSKGSSVPSGEEDFTQLSTKTLLTHPSKVPSYSSSSANLSVSDGGRKISSSPTESTYMSATFSRGVERTPQSGTSSSIATETTETSATDTITAKYSDSTRISPSEVLTEGRNSSSRDDARFTEPSTKSLHPYFSKASTYSSETEDPSTTGRSHQSLGSSSTEERISRPYTDSTYASATLTKSEERTSQSLTNSTSTHTTERPTSYTKIVNSSELFHSFSEVQTKEMNVSADDMGLTGLSTETLFTHSSKIPTYSSFQSDASSIASSHQPISGTDTEKRTSASRTDSMYSSTTFSRGGERTLLSISSNSTSTDSSESSTFFTESSNSSSISQASSVSQSRENNVSSSDGTVMEPSTEPLLVYSSKIPTYSSTGRIQNTTLSYTGSESAPTGSSSLSSSGFQSSASVSSFYRSPSSTPAPPPLFTTSQSSLPPTLSVLPSTSPPPLPLSSLPTSSPVTASSSFSFSSPSFSSQSSSVHSNDSSQTSASTVTTEATDGGEPSTAVFSGSFPGEYDNHSSTNPLKESTGFSSTELPPFPATPTEHLANHSAFMPTSSLMTESTVGAASVATGDSIEKTPSFLTTVSLSMGTERTNESTTTLPSPTSRKEDFPVVELTTEKSSTVTHRATLGLTTGHSATTEVPRVQTVAPTKLASITGITTEAIEASTTASSKLTKESIPATHFSEATSISKTTAGFPSSLTAATKPTIVALTTTTVTSSHTTDVDECLSNPCPVMATCNNTQGSFVCKCPLGYQLEKGKCNLVRTFVGQGSLKLNTTHGKYSDVHQVQDEITTMLNMSLSTLPGYCHSIVKAARESNSVRVSVQTTFLLASNVTLKDIRTNLQNYARACKSPPETCQFLSGLTQLHTAGGLCEQKDPECDKETSECRDFDGIAVCNCRSGYFKYNKKDHSCRACEDGFKLENETCVSCPFGLGGFNCGNPYQLITVVIAAAGGGLLLILGIALIITCCRKNKNDISKLIFKSGDFQMSPYAEYPKNPRGPEWGRETIEMQENGSTKNLLQMTDVYYSPTNLRNPELERNGLYPPYTGLPGSRHSCIYPGQYNPSFISDETRRRDYF
ncbi:PREDICTED: protein HEG homolog 1 isoform X2 [Crocodylus porosus]|uniref:protein HEG homolog 1 isoform X2 n=1 Tax=Crocodylus porosus TaxID=8502 RepID=UPI00093BC72F|nr:PREDICTED: protein HEG homolog 1 isoform X2 [Crocodylus porosus]